MATMLDSVARIVARDLGRYIRSVWVRARYAVRGVALDTQVTLTVTGQAEIHIEPGVVVRRGSILVASDERAPGVNCLLAIGARSAINEYANIRAAGGCIYIGCDCLISQFVTIVATNYDLSSSSLSALSNWDLRSNQVHIEDGVWVGAHAVILPGVRIGLGAVVAAGAVVTQDIPPGEIWGGCPARLLRRREAT
jgi:acetyltransferase-like isoleucine patch superfamily enzyme